MRPARLDFGRLYSDDKAMYGRSAGGGEGGVIRRFTCAAETNQK